MDLKFGETSGIQCASNLFFCHKVCKWKSWNSDYLLNCGDTFIKSRSVNCSATIDKLKTSVKVENYEIRAAFLQLCGNLLNTVDLVMHHNYLSSKKTGNGANLHVLCLVVLLCGVVVAFTFYFVDPHSWDS